MLTRPFFLLIVAILTGAKTPDVRIVGGRLAEEGEFPFQVSIRRSYNDAHYCGGSLITPKHVLTAAHCMFYAWGGPLPPQLVSVSAGQLGLKLTPKSVYRNASKITTHPLYNSRTYANDVAIVELGEALPQNGLISVVPINVQKITANTSCTVTGWGTQDFASYAASPDLLAAKVNVVGFDNCENMYRVVDVNLSPGMMCANNEQKKADACQGDSGGPLVCEGRLVGVISTGNECADPKFPGIYSDVAYFMPWIREILTDDISVMTARSDVFDISSGYPLSENVTNSPTSLEVLFLNFLNSLSGSGCISGQAVYIFLGFACFLVIF